MNQSVRRKKGALFPSSSLRDSARHGNDVFLWAPHSDSSEEAAGQKKEGEAAVKGEHDDSPLITLGCKWGNKLSRVDKRHISLEKCRFFIAS